MNAPLAEGAIQQEKEHRPRWRDRIPVDDIAQQHEPLHEILIRWGAWNAQRANRANSQWAGGLYARAGTPAATAPLELDPLLITVERAVTRMPRANRDTIRWLYVWRYTPHTICRSLRPRLRFEAWAAWIFVSRCMVVNLMRRHG